jgi:hypothetical protein
MTVGSIQSRDLDQRPYSRLSDGVAHGVEVVARFHGGSPEGRCSDDFKANTVPTAQSPISSAFGTKNTLKPLNNIQGTTNFRHLRSFK